MKGNVTYGNGRETPDRHKDKLGSATLDAMFKKLIRMPEVIAPIIAEVAGEFAGMGLGQVYECVRKSKITGNVLLLAEEDTGMGEETEIFFDSLTEMEIPGRNLSIDTCVVMDFEMQHDKPSGYILEDRSQYYAARLLSRQLARAGREGEGYAGLRPVYTVWIVREPYKEQRGTVRHFEYRDEAGKTVDGYGRGKSLSHVVMVYLPKPGDTPENELLKYLMALFTGDYSQSGLTKLITEKRDLQEEVEEIMSLEELVMERGKRQGIAQGLEQGIAQGIEQGIEQGKVQGLKQGITQGSKMRQLSQIINNCRRNRDAELVADILGTDREYILKVYGILEEHPGWDEKDLYQYLEEKDA